MTTIEDRQNVLVRSLQEIRRLRGELERMHEPIAITGIGCRMPGAAPGPDGFWDLLSGGRDAVRDFPAERGSMNEFYDPTGVDPGTSYTRRGGFLSDIDQFDAPFFGISPREAASLDPQQRLLLEVTWEALENAGQAPDRLAGTDTGVFLGIANRDYSQAQLQQVAPADLDAYWATSNAGTFGAGRLSYWLGLQGPSLSVDTSCSSSLVAVHLAVQSLRSGESTLALAGGVNVLLSPESFVALSKTRALSPDGLCRTFDKAANGFVRGEGCGVIVLKRLSDALVAHDRILAVIRGSAINQDGRSSGITVPNPRAQQAVLRKALRSAGLTPDRVGYVEAHGTGTPLGDPIELRALAAVLGERGDAGPLRVGSVKTNIGHLEPAAGVAGLIKVVLCLQRGQIPPHLNLNSINPEIGVDERDLEIPTELVAWPAGTEARVGGVSSFGASGTNAHLLIEEAPPPAPADPGRDRNLLTLSARTPEALADLADRFRRHLATADPADLADICFTANTGRARFAHRMAVTGSSPAQLARQIEAGDITRGHVGAGRRPGVAFLFTGQGAQYAGMAARLRRTEPLFAQVLDRADEVLRPLLPVTTAQIVADQALLDDTRYTQPVLFAVQYALAEVWRSLGVEPVAVLGHSAGELAAACVAGAMTFEDGLRLAAGRGRLMSEVAPGAMATVFATLEQVEQALAPYSGQVSVAAVNAAEMVVVSGAADALAELLAELGAGGVRTKLMPGRWAFHSPLMDAMLPEFESLAGSITYTQPRVPLISNLTGGPLAGVDAVYWRDHVRRPVLFSDGLAAIVRQGGEVLVEIGPAPTLLTLARRSVPEVAAVPSMRPRRDDDEVLLEGIGRLFTLGVDVELAALDADRVPRRTALPTYPFQRARHWFEPSDPQVTPGAGSSPDVPGRPTSLLGQRVSSPLGPRQYRSSISPAQHPCLADCVIDGLAVVNIGVFLETAFRAAREVFGDGALVAEGTLVPQGLVRVDDGPTEVQLHLDADGSFRYFADPAGNSHADREGAGWVLHAQGRVGVDADLGTPSGGTAHRADEQAALGAELTGADFYAGLWRRKLYLGPSARWVEHIWHGENEAIALMRAPLPGEAEPYLLHPGLTDAMFQVLFACLPASADPDAVYALVGIDRFEFHGLPPGEQVYCRAVLSPASDPASTLIAEVWVEDGQGRTVAHAGGVYAKRAGRSSILRDGANGHQVPTGHPARPAQVPPAPRAAAVSDLTQASPAERPAALRRLLESTIARVLRMPETVLDVREPLANLGLDSLMALEVRDSLSADLGVAVPLVAFLEGSSIAKLADLIEPLLDIDGEPAISAREQGTSGRQGNSGEALPVIVHDPIGRYEPFGLTDIQQAYLVGRSGAFALGNVSTYFYLEVDLEEVDLDRVTTAWNDVVRRHDMLRAVVTPDGRQRVLPEVPQYRPAVTDLRQAEAGARQAHLDAVHQEMKHQVLDAGSWPVFDIRASRLDARTTRLHIGMDALIMDAWSTTVVFGEWAEAYAGRPSPPDLPIVFRDYVVAARALEAGPSFRRSLDYWLARVETLAPAPDLPLAVDPDTLARPEFTHRSFRLDAEEWARFKERAVQAGVTPSAALCTAYAQTLANWCRAERFSLNVLFFNRLPLHPDVGRVVGNFTTTTLLEVDTAPEHGFGVRATALQRQLWTDLEHSQVSGIRVLREISRVRGGSGPITMPVVFASTVNFGSRENPGAATGLTAPLITMGESGREQWSSIRTPQVWLDHQVIEDAGGAVLNWDSVDALFPAGLIDSMFAGYLDVVRDLCADEAAWRRPAALLTPVAELAARQEVNATAGPLPAGLLHDGFVTRAAAHPERTAVISADRTLTYGELDRVSNQVGAWVRNAVGHGGLVAIVMEKGWQQVAAALGVLKAGAAYVPIDADVPPERLRLLLGTAGIRSALTQHRIGTAIEWPDGVSVLEVDGPQTETFSGATMSPAVTTDADLAYVIFTSGSTGVPKGVMIEHRAALNTILDVNERFAITDTDRVLAMSALNFDLSVYDVFGLLAAGGAVVLPEPADHREPARWAELVAEHDVTLWNTVPMLMEMFAEYLLAAGASVPRLRTVMLSGDWIPVTLPDRIRRIAPGAAIWSLGGATEAAIWSILYPIDRVDLDRPSIPYGKPMLNQYFQVLDRRMRPAPVWVAGNLYIGGSGLARGYLDDPDRTRSSFVRHPVTGERLYRTGDLGRYLPDGNIEFLGREDFQVKVQGYRIELGEIEATMLRMPGVRAAAVIAAGSRHEAKRLIGYVVPDVAGDIDGDGVRRSLLRELPQYLVPQQVVVLEEMPLSSNGKVDRARLPAVSRPGRTGAGPVAPRDALERRLAEIWNGFFGAEVRNIDDSFFDLGGDSLLAVRMMAAIETQLGRSLPVATLFARPSIEQLAEVLRDVDADLRRVALVPVRAGGTRPPLFFIHPVGGDVLCYADLALLLPPDQPFHCLQTPDLEPAPTTIAELAAHYAEAITEAVPTGPYRIGGWSMGGVIALETARLLTDASAEVDLVVVVDLLEPPGPADGPAIDEAVLLAWFGRDLAGLAEVDWEPRAEDLRAQDGRTPLEVLHREAVTRGVLPSDIGLDTLAPIVGRFSCNARALSSHEPRPYYGTVRFLRAADGGASVATAAQWLALLPGDSSVIDVPGNHFSAMREPHLQVLADALNLALTKGVDR